MNIDYETLTAGYLICGFVFGSWFTYQRFRGGRDSAHYREMRRRFPSVDVVNPWLVFAGAAVGVVAYSIVWPYALVVNLRAMRRTRRNSFPLYLHPQLAKVRSKLAGREEQYEEVLSRFDLGVAVTALHAIDLAAVVEHGLDAITKKKALPERAKAEDYDEATYVNVIKVAVGYLESVALEASMNRAKLNQAMSIGDELTRRFDHIRNAGITIGEIITFHTHGWAPAAKLTTVKEKYSQCLKPEFNNADHIAAIFGGIRVTDERDVRSVVVKGSNLTSEDYESMVEDYKAGKTNPPAPQPDDTTATH